MPRAGRFGTPSAPAAAGGGGAPSGAAGGDLAGTYPDPTIGTDKVVTAKILDKNVTLAKIADLAEALVLGRAAGAGTGVPTGLTATQVRTLLALAAVATSGSASDLATGTLPIARIADAAVTLAKQADIATARIRGRVTAGTGVPEDLTAAQARSVLGMPALGAALTASVTTSEGTTSTTYAELATTGPTLTVTIGPSGMALVSVGALCSNGTASDGALASVSVAGAAADDDDAAGMSNSTSGGLGFQVRSTRSCLFTGLTPGPVVFLMKYRAVTGGTATFARRRLVVVPLS